MSGDDRNFEFFMLSSQPLQIVDTSDSLNGKFMGFFWGWVSVHNKIDREIER
jgi:hypothetical protein